MSQDKKKESIKESFDHFKKNVKTLHLSTITRNGKPNASYSPFVSDAEGHLYIFVSGLASHTQDLLDTADASVLLMEDEAKTRQIFARQRISYQCSVEIVSRKNEGYLKHLNAMEKRFGNIMELLRTLPDFILFRLTPHQGQYVKGFGKAYKLIGSSLLELEHIAPNKK